MGTVRSLQFSSVLFLAATARAQTDRGPPSVALVQAGPPGCAAAGQAQEPAFDPARFAGCWLPPALCPPLELVVPAGRPLVVPFAGLPPGAPALLVASPATGQPLVQPCVFAVDDVFELLPGADATGRATATVPTPPISLALSGVVVVAQVQLLVLDVTGNSVPPLLATSRVLRLEVRF